MASKIYPSTTKQAKAAYGKLYYQNNKKLIKAKVKKWKVDNQSDYITRGRAYHNSVNGRARSLLCSARKRSGKRNEEMTIDFEWIKARLDNGACEITGLPFVFETRFNGHRNPYSPSLDRRDNSKGYTKENCRVILWALNMGFADWGQEIYIKIAKRLIEFDL